MEPDKRPQLVLGAAQLGLAYGAANSAGFLSSQDAGRLLDEAWAAGVRTFDTARAYGESEARIGAWLAGAGAGAPVEIVTKLDPLGHLTAGSLPAEVRAAVRKSIADSAAALGRDRIDVLILHRCAHRTAWGGECWNQLLAARDAGLIGRLGVSAQSPDELLAALADPDVQHVQFPYNLLDYRWDEAGVPLALSRRPDVRVHVRSALLQGLLSLAPHARWPVWPGFDPREITRGVSDLVERLGRQGPVDLALAYVLSQGWIDGVVIGMETTAQLHENLALVARPPLAASEVKLVHRDRPRAPARLLDPSLWNAPAQV
jgi:spore coat polysaccharide biosynthesis protein SpsF